MQELNIHAIKKMNNDLQRFRNEWTTYVKKIALVSVDLFPKSTKQIMEIKLP